MNFEHELRMDFLTACRAALHKVSQATNGGLAQPSNLKAAINILPSQSYFTLGQGLCSRSASNNPFKLSSGPSELLCEALEHGLPVKRTNPGLAPAIRWNF